MIIVPQSAMIIVTTAKPDFDWDIADEHERAILNIVANYLLKAVKS